MVALFGINYFYYIAGKVNEFSPPALERRMGDGACCTVEKVQRIVTVGPQWKTLGCKIAC